MTHISYGVGSAYLLRMPRKILFGRAKQIERWLRENDKQRPTLLDLESARRAVKRGTRR